MESLIVIINLSGAVALLLFGLAQVKDGASRALGSKLRTSLATGTKSSVRSFLTGFVATVALQSSTATALMVSSFVERELIKPRMAQVVLLGANVGTAVTAWIVATGIEWISPFLLVVGIVLYRGGSTSRQGAGTAMIGIALMLLSLHLLSAATEPLRHSQALGAFIGLLDDAWPVAMILAAVIAFVSSSSLAAVVLILSLATTGLLSGGLVVALVLGANLGGAIPPVIAALSGPAASRRVTLGNLIVRAIGCVLTLPAAGILADWLSMLPLPYAKLPVDAHLAFNIALALLAWPFSKLLARWMTILIPEEAQTENTPKFLDPDELSTPIVALTSASREVLGVGDLIERMLLKVSDAFERNNAARLRDISPLERQVDRLQQEVKVYLSKLGRAGLSEDEGRRSIVIIDYAINLEHIGDIIEKGLLPEVTKKIGQGLKFSDDGFAELQQLFQLTIDNLRIAQTILITRDVNLAKQLMERKIEVRHMEKRSSERHLERLRDGRTESLQTSSLHLDILRDLKRINAHIVSVAHPIMDEQGLLGESRLITGSSTERPQ
ncbi:MULTISPECIES: Na/Pi cotransporter family protein [Rhizobium/Agrobacterium group]|uniref:Na/Pi cotransporter family protein n=1 Tax=Agrobacterium vitis TaxID=373 RepID=A0ABW9TJG6_AGRVI|nr:MULTISPECIES: Na/Pi cotransporter family protein [Rhizobium/Agrobacterium group]MCF1495032.1 Na/Pi cotransporter family protein [Allorhizobium ampelinum]MCW8059450.1 Na/Pi cotransporter family protein [Agrobacterium tumefaciens]MCW8145449.1 Na/Pi cotransporter family protein [Agrobacterium tumefaciens]MQB13271.1 Na/Pi cotransporter family protein [Agrobacterium sp. ICMP 6402]MUO42924.1 Na/Pi cotransporter family protein [Agrobacterium vitis]